MTTGEQDDSKARCAMPVGIASTDQLGVAPKRANLRMKLQLFPGERAFMWALIVFGCVCTIGAKEWQGLGWCLTCCCWWRYSCALEDRNDDDA